MTAREAGGCSATQAGALADSAGTAEMRGHCGPLFTSRLPSAPVHARSATRPRTFPVLGNDIRIIYAPKVIVVAVFTSRTGRFLRRRIDP
jgi:hypothetical protein